MMDDSRLEEVSKMLRGYAVHKTVWLATVIAVATISCLSWASAAVDPDVVGSWFEQSEHCADAMVLRADGTFTSAYKCEGDDRHWTRGTFSTAAGGVLNVTIEATTDPTETVGPFEAAYSVDGSRLSITTGEGTFGYDRAASYANLPSAAVGQWLVTHEWEGGQWEEETSVERFTINEYGLMWVDWLSGDDAGGLGFWGLFSANAANTEMTLISVYTDSSEDDLGPMTMAFSLTDGNNKLEVVDEVRLSRLLDTVDPDLLGTWVMTDQTELTQVGPRAAPDSYFTLVWDDQGGFYNNSVFSGSDWWWKRGDYWHTADGYFLIITRH